MTGAALLFHGNTMNFYVGAPRFLPPALTAMGYVCLAFNRRGHDILSIRNSRAAEGAAFQLTHEGIEDNRTAARWMAERGLPPPVIIGHSNGGMLAVPHVVAHPDTPALILLSAHGGGTEACSAPSRSGLMAGDRLTEITAQARAMVAEGAGRELMLMPGWWYAISAESFLDRMTEMPDILELAPRVRCPVLYICAATRRMRRIIRPRHFRNARVAGAMFRSFPIAIIFIKAARTRSSNASPVGWRRSDERTAHAPAVSSRTAWRSSSRCYARDDAAPRSTNGTSISTSAVHAADTTINGARWLTKTCSNNTAPIVSDNGAARLMTDINAAKT